jgi:AraC-like DNA-binding protein
MGLVECVWMLSHSAEPPPSREIQRIPPDGTVEIIFHLGDPFEQLTGRRARRQPAGMIVGVWTRSMELVAPGSFDTVGIRLRPGAASAFWAEPLTAFSDSVVDAGALWGRSADALRDRLAETPGAEDRIAIIEAFLRARSSHDRRALNGPLSRITESRGRAPIDQVAREAGISNRQLERAFNMHVGVSPKMFSRIVRFQHALRYAPGTAGAWVDVALRCGYADQSHLIRDFTQFAGETPTALAASTEAVAGYFRRR